MLWIWKPARIAVCSGGGVQKEKRKRNEGIILYYQKIKEIIKCKSIIQKNNKTMGQNKA